MVVLIIEPVVDWVPPLILRLVTKWRKPRSAALFVGGNQGAADTHKRFGQMALDLPTELA